MMQAAPTPDVIEPWFPGASWLVVAYLVVFVCTVAGSYGWAVGRGDVYPMWPFISDTGAMQPERSYFGLGLNLIAALTLGIVFVRQVQLQAYHEDVAWLNRWSYRAGVISSVGLLLIANFQDNEGHVKAVHFVGAFTTFGGGLIYCWMQTVISRRTSEACSLLPSPAFSTTQLIFATAANGVATSLKMQGNYPAYFVVLLVLFGIFFTVSYDVLPYWRDVPQGCMNSSRPTDGGSDIKPWAGQWEPCLHGYSYHLVATVSEWLMAVVYILFFATFLPEFRRLDLVCSPRLSGHSYQAVSSTVNHVF